MKVNSIPCYWAYVVLASVMSTPVLGIQELRADEEIATFDHYIKQISLVPSIEGQFTQIYVRERVKPSMLEGSESLEGQVVLFVHGSSLPAYVAFDLPHENYSWMKFLANNGFDVFSVDMTGYGRSTRPNVMNDPCNLPEENRKLLGIEPVECEASYPYRITTAASDGADIERAVQYILELRKISRLSMVGWSSGSIRVGGFAAKNLENIDRIVLFAPRYDRTSASTAPSEMRNEPGMRAAEESASFDSWNSRVNCAEQADPNAQKILWSTFAASDPVGATWGSGGVRYPRTVQWGWNRDIASKSTSPTLIISGALDDDRNRKNATDLYEDLGGKDKVFVDLACSSHFAQFESNRETLFQASLEWLRDGSVKGVRSGKIKLGK